MKCYKGFNKNLQCRGFQYEIGKDYTEEKASICSQGFHACEFPLNVFKYYPPSTSRFCEVELDVNDQISDDTKRVGKHIKIKEEIGIFGLIEESIDYIKNHLCLDNDNSINQSYRGVSINTNYYSTSINTADRGATTNTGGMSIAKNIGDRSAATNTGNMSVVISSGKMSAATNTGGYSVATNQGYRSTTTNTGDCSAASNIGDKSTATNTGDSSIAINIGYKSVSTNTGNNSTAINSGACSVATNTGDCSVAINTGDCSSASVERNESVAIATGYQGKAKGGLGCFLVLADWRIEPDGSYHIADVKSVQVDGVNIKADTFYTLVNNEFIEVEE